MLQLIATLLHTRKPPECATLQAPPSEFIFGNSEYRAQIEPFAYALKAVGITTQTAGSATPSPTPVLLAHNARNADNSIASKQQECVAVGFYDVAVRVEELLQHDTRFTAQYALSARENASVFALYEQILADAIASEDESNASSSTTTTKTTTSVTVTSECDNTSQQMQQPPLAPQSKPISHKQPYTRESSFYARATQEYGTALTDAVAALAQQYSQTKRLSLSHLVLYEALKLLESVQVRGEVFAHTRLHDFVVEIELTDFLQMHVFDSALLTRRFVPPLRNANADVHAAVAADLDKFTMYANITGASYRYHGVGDQRAKDSDFTEHAPFSVLPYEIDDLRQFDGVAQKTTLWNRLIYEMSLDDAFIEENFAPMDDDFVQRHLAIWRKAKAHGSTTYNGTRVAVVRNDMMYDAHKREWFQIEFNTFSVGLVHVTDCVQDLHAALLRADLKAFSTGYEHVVRKNADLNVDAIMAGLAQYAPGSGSSDSDAPKHVLVIVGDFEGNQYDQRFIEFGLARRGVVVVRKSFTHLLDAYAVAPDGRLYVDGKEIHLIYFRHGYSPDHYKSDAYWRMREDIEITQAVKLPNVALTLVNFKKAQEALQQADVLARFAARIVQEGDAHEQARVCARVAQNFARIYAFEGDVRDDAVMRLARQNAKAYVLKPQREGGANNFYGEDIVRVLDRLTPQQRKAYILMERVRSRPRCGFLVYRRALDVAPVIAEVGFVGYFCEGKGDGAKRVLVVNESGGYLCRTKRFYDNEGGVAMGYSVIDSCRVKVRNAGIPSTEV